MDFSIPAQNTALELVLGPHLCSSFPTPLPRPSGISPTVVWCVETVQAGAVLAQLSITQENKSGACNRVAVPAVQHTFGWEVAGMVSLCRQFAPGHAHKQLGFIADSAVATAGRPELR